MVESPRKSAQFLVAFTVVLSAASAKAQINAWYELVDSSGPGEGVVNVQQGAAGAPLIITTDDEPGAYEFTIRFVVDIEETDSVVSYAVDLVAPDSDIISTSSLTFLTVFDFDDLPMFSTGPGEILMSAGQFNIFSGGVFGELELFDVEVSVSEPPAVEIEIFSEIAPLEWALLTGGPAQIAFADSTPITSSAGSISSTPSIVIRRGTGGGGGGFEDCNANDVPDDEEIAADPAVDCNENGIPDTCDLADGTSPDCNADGFPDECDLGDGFSPDCNDNAIPDECDILDGAAEDCNANGNPDECDLADGSSSDCNGNSIPDDCDLDDGESQDCDANGTPDECDVAANLESDCNANGVPDACDLANGTSQDADADSVPDECDGTSPGATTVGRVCLRRTLGFLFNVPVDGGAPTVSGIPLNVLGILGLEMSLRLLFMEWMDLPLRYLLFEMAYALLDAVLP